MTHRDATGLGRSADGGNFEPKRDGGYLHREGTAGCFDHWMKQVIYRHAAVIAEGSALMDANRQSGLSGSFGHRPVQ